MTSRQQMLTIKWLVLFTLVLLVSLLARGTARAQSALDGFNPNADSNVFAIAVQADGKILLGGGFTAIGGLMRNCIARLNADGTLDTGFNPGADEPVSALVVQPDGKILVGGSFTMIGGQGRNSIARLNADGTVDTGFNPDALGGVSVLALQTDGRILVGGGFMTIGGQSHKFIARLNSDGTLDAGFNPNADDVVNVLAVQTDGKILVGGQFHNIGGQARNFIARLNTNGTADAGYNPNADDAVQTLAVQVDGKVLVGGDFSLIGGQTRNFIVRLNIDGTADAGFNPSANGPVLALALQTNGKILVGGVFTNIGGEDRLRIAGLNQDGSVDISEAGFFADANGNVGTLAIQKDGKILAGGGFTTIGGQARNHIARLYSTGAVEVDSDPNANDEIFALAVQADGKVLVGGNFITISGQSRNRLTRLNVDGTLDSDFNPDVDGEVFALAVQADGNILVGGNFTNIGGVPRAHLARLTPDGNVDTTFIANTDNTVQSIVIQANGKILVGGNFTTIAGADVSRIVRLNTDGTRDTGFNANADSDVHAIVVQPGGTIVLGGFFTSVNGQPRNRIARVNSDGTIDSDFNPDANENVDSLVLQPDGKILVGGNFTSIGGQTRNHLARLTTDGSLDAGFNPNVGSVVYALLVQTDGKILAGGSFASVGGQVRNGVARLNSDGSLDTGFDPNVDSAVFSMAMQVDGKITIGGLFSNVGGQARNRIARLTNSSAFQTLSGGISTAFKAPRNGLQPGNWLGWLANWAGFQPLSPEVAGVDITWTRSGTSPEVDRVTFEQSTDFGGSWTPLGNGSRVGITSDWELTGLNLPAGQNLLLRARGYPLAGNFGGGDSSVYESVKEIYLAAANTAPVFNSVATLTRQQGSAASNSAIATVSDAESGAGSLIVTTLTVPAGITITNIVNTAGTITADVAASCTAATGANTVILQVSDGSSATTGNLTINVSANTAPTLTYNNASLLVGNSATVNPVTGPTDNGSIASIVLLSQGTYTGSISVNNATGLVSISNAAPVGTHTITIRATDNCGAVTDATFMLTVQACSYSINPSVQSFSAAGGNGTVALTTGGVCSWTVVNNAPTWITVTSSGSSTGNGTVAFTVSPNAASTPRSGTLTIAGQTFTVTQIASGAIVVGDFSTGIPPAWMVVDGGTPAVYNNTGTPLTWTTLNPCNRVIPPPFSSTFVIMDAACTIPGVVLDEELRLPPFDATGLGSVFVEFYSQFEWDASAPNNKGDLDVSTDGGQTWTNVFRLENGSDGDPIPVLKSVNITPYIASNPSNVLVRLHYYGVSPPVSLRAAQGKVSWAVDFGVYSYAFTPSSQSFPASGGTGSIAVATSSAITAPQGEWMAVSNVPWITITSSASVRGNGTVTFSVEQNIGGTRTGTITVSGRTFTVTQSCVPSPAGLIAWYSGEDNANDRQGTNNGTLRNSANFAAGLVGRAFNFDGVNDYVSTALDTQPSALPNMTWEAWVYPTRVNHTARQSIFSTDDGGFDRAVTIEANSANFGVFTGAGVWQPVGVSLNQWQHIAVVYTASTIEFYKDGVKYTFAGTPSGQATANRFTIGRNPSAGAAAGEYYQGLVDEVGVYNRALTQAEIQTIVNANSAGRCGVCPTTTVGPENGSLPSGRVGQSYSQSFTANGGDLPYTFTLNTGNLPDGLAIGPDGLLSGTPTASGEFSFTVRATDSNGCSGVGSYSLTIQPACMTITIGPGSIAGGIAGVPYSQLFTQTGGTGAVTFSTISTLPVGITLSSGGLLSGTTNQNGSFPITIKATDANGCFGKANYTLIISCSGVTLSSLPGGTAGSAYSQTVTASPSGSYTFAVTAGSLPPGLSLAAGGAITGTPALAGTFTFTLTATNSNSCIGARTYSLVINCPAVAIAIAPATLPAATANTAYALTLSATPPGTSYTFAVTSGVLPPGLTLNSNGSWSGAPTQSGVFNFRVTATGFGTCTGFRDYTLIVNCSTVTLTPESLPGGTIGTSYNQTVSASPAGTYNYAVTSGALPPGLTLNASSGAITGTPATNGSFSFVITASAGTGNCRSSLSYTITIGCQGISFTTTALPTGSAGNAYSQTLAVTPAGSYSFTLLTGSLPSGVTLNPTAGVIGGTPSVPGTYTFTVRALSSNGCSVTQGYSLVISCPAITLAPATLPGGTVGTAYNQILSASPAGGGYTFVVTSGALPNGLNLNPATGILSGAPAANGTFTFTITGTGFGGCSGSKPYTVVIGGGECSPVTLPELPSGSVGQFYSNSVAASPSGTYSYEVTAGSLPPGLTLFGSFGLIYGYPTTVGTYNFTITATAGACSGSRNYSLLINAGFASSLTVFSDFDGDGKSDLAVWRGDNAQGNNWLVANSGNGQVQSTMWGSSAAPYNDWAVSGDYDGDGKTDLAVFRRGGEQAGNWYIKRSRDGHVTGHFWGLGTDVPVPGDYDGDGKTDVAVWRGSAGAWYILRSSDGGVTGILWGSAAAGDIPVPGDYDGDGKTDAAVFRKSDGYWYIKRSSDGVTISTKWGVGTDVPVPGDYDGDGKTDIAVWRASEGNWYIIESGSSKIRTVSLGTQSDVPVAADYDGDGKADAAVWRASTGMWLVKRSSDGAEMSKALGQNGDVPILARMN